jgi:hypothetical protein
MTLRFVRSGALACSLLLAACTEGYETDFSAQGGPGQGAGNPNGAGGAANGAGAASANGGASATGGASANGSGSANGGASANGSGSAAGGASAAGGGDGAGASASYRVFASTDTKLFALDPNAPELPLVEVGVFDCVDPDYGPHTSMVDIAVNRHQHLWGTTGYSVMPLIPSSGQVLCGGEIPISNVEPGKPVPAFYALTFAPVGVLDPMREVLVAGNTAGELWSIDAMGKTAKIGMFGFVPETDGQGHKYDPAHIGKRWELSGDIVFLANDGDPVGFATVRDCPAPPSISGCSKTDTLLEIDMARLKLPDAGDVTKAVRGKILKRPGCPPGAVEGSMFGIAAWNDAVFGFSRTGRIVSIDTADAGGCLVKAYLEEKFSGAGVTTLAPVDVPPLQ